MPFPRHGGNIGYLSRISHIPEDEILDFSANINPLGPPEWFRPTVSRILSSVAHYPDPECRALIQAAARRYGCSDEEIFAGNGSSEILFLLPRAVRRSKAIIMTPSYGDYASAMDAVHGQWCPFILNEVDHFVPRLTQLTELLTGDEMVFLCNPNNPTGLLLDTADIRELAYHHPSTLFVVDEAFGDFVEGMDSLTHRRPSNVVVLLSLTKIFAIPGLRLGLAVGEPSLVAALRAVQPTWSVNFLAQAVGTKALGDEDYRAQTRAYVARQRQYLVTRLSRISGLHVYPGAANFLLVRIDRCDIDAHEVAKSLLKKGIAIRVCSNFQGLDRRFFRIGVRREEENDRLCEELEVFLGNVRRPRTRRKTRAIMFQGTSSNAGKSLMTAAVGRILFQDGLRVAPFKAQNMSLNSFVTRDGGEMGRAQVLQAQACRLEPDVRMNPVLLKPNSNIGSQVILMGKPVGNMDVMEYVRFKPQAFEIIKQAYDSLASEFDVMVIEGAGSPGEVNLKHHDIVNMRMAEYARAPVLLLGDIDRGGLFASFVGTMEVLTEWERRLVSGFVVNKFRGEKDLLQDALEYMERRTGLPVLGVVPYLQNHGLPEEDSVTFKEERKRAEPSMGKVVRIGVIDLPHISNFTDFDALRAEPDVQLVVVRHPDDLDLLDAVILPGSKNTIGDLSHLKATGMADRLFQLVREGVELVGICGGFQMLGTKIADPHGLESAKKFWEGLGLLEMTTVMAPEKTLRRSEGIHRESGLPVKGYEIHHGLTEYGDLPSVICWQNGQYDGASSVDGRVWGTYLHGIFDSDEFRRWFIDRLRVRKGLSPGGRVLLTYDLEPALDRLAEVVRTSLDISRIYRLLRL